MEVTDSDPVFQAQGTGEFALTGSKAGIQAHHARRLELVLSLKNAAKRPENMNFPGSHFHLLHPAQNGIYSVRVNGNWRVTFRFTDAGPEDLDYIDYH